MINKFFLMVQIFEIYIKKFSKYRKCPEYLLRFFFSTENVQSFFKKIFNTENVQKFQKFLIQKMSGNFFKIFFFFFFKKKCLEYTQKIIYLYKCTNFRQIL